LCEKASRSVLASFVSSGASRSTVDQEGMASQV
jgi:hypothetical protein